MSLTKHVKFQIRTGTSTQWESGTIILACGEPGYDSTNHVLKIGDGVNSWSGLTSISGSGGGVVDTSGLSAQIRNVGLNAYVESIIASAIFDPITLIITYTFKIFGNSSIYDIQCKFPTGKCSPNPQIYALQNNTIINNKSGLTAQFTTTLSDIVSGTYDVGVVVYTINAGGIGLNSSATTTITNVKITSADTMGAPSAIYSLSLTPTIVTYSGINYYGSGTYIRFAKYGMTFSNIYNTVPATFATINPCVILSDSLGGSNSYSSSILSYNNAGTYLSIGDTTIPQNSNYTNNAVLTYTLTSSLNQSLNFNMQVFNSLSKNNTYTPLTNLGYVGNASTNIETTINIDSIRTNKLIASQTRLSLATGSYFLPPISTSGPIPQTNFKSISTTPTIYDLAYNPFDQNLYASGIINALTNYNLPNVALWSDGTKYLVIDVLIKGAIPGFSIAINAVVENIYVYWGASYGGWLDATIPITSQNGCRSASLQNEGVKNTWFVAVNEYTTVGNSNSYSQSYTAYGSAGHIYIMIKTSTSIPLNPIIIS